MDSLTPGRGDQFITAVEAAYAAIAAQPRLQPPIDDGPPEIETRQMRIRGFRYRVIFAILDEKIFVLAVGHLHRRPGYWLDRLTEDS